MNKRRVLRYLCLFWMTLSILSFNVIYKQQSATFLSSCTACYGQSLPFDSQELELLVGTIRNYATGFASGFWEYMILEVQYFILLLRHPIATFRELASGVYHYDETYSLVRDYVDNVLAEYPSYDAAAIGRLHIMILTGITWMFFPIHISPNLFLSNTRFSRWEKMNFFLQKNKQFPQVRLSSGMGKLVEQMDLIGTAEWFASDGSEN